MTDPHPPSSAAGAAPPRLHQQGHVALKRCRHGLFAYNIHDTFIGRSLDLYGEWAELELRALAPFVPPGAVVLDVGANIGTHTVFLARRAGAAGAVLAFEPQRLPYQLLCTNATLNALPNVHAMNQAVGDARGQILVPPLLPDAPANVGAMSLEGHTRGVPVEVVPVDALGLSRCDLIKVDVEGMEAKVIAGARRTISATRPVLFVENNTLEQGAPLVEALLALDYRLWWHIAPYYNPDNFFGNTHDIFGAGYRPEANMLCLPREAGHTPAGLTAVSGPEDNWRRALERRARPA